LLLNSGYVIVAAAEEFQQTKVTKHLQLLADFVADVAVTGMAFDESGTGIPACAVCSN